MANNLSITLSKDVTQWFFDRQKVIQRMERAKLRKLSRIGAFVRRRARSSVRKRKAVSQPGNPPHRHAESYGVHTIFFALDSRRDAVMVGPVRLTGGSPAYQERSTATTVPNLLEFGGEARVIQVLHKGRWKPLTPEVRKDKAKIVRVRKRKAKYKPRPFMYPALQAEIEAGTIAKEFVGVLGDG